MSNKNIKINQQILQHFYREGKIKVLYMYVVSSYVVAGYGYAHIDDYTKKIKDLCGCSTKTVQRWISRLREEGFLNLRKGVIYIKGKKKVEAKFGKGSTYIKFEPEHLEFYSEFKNHVIRQTALLVQRRMSYGISRNRKNIDTQSLIDTGIVPTSLGVVKSSKRAGCSISILAKRLNTDKMTISRALKGYTEKQYGETKPIAGKIARFKYKSILNNDTGGDHRWSYLYNNKKDTYIIRYALSSRIKVDSYLSK